jgi:hypothetical protein
LFLRLQGALETTGTFKYRKSDLAAQGFDPGAVGEPIFFRDPEKGYVPLDADLHASIRTEPCGCKRTLHDKVGRLVSPSSMEGRMTDGMQGLRDDVAFMRGLAEEGRKAPLLGGSISVAAGAIYGAASLGHYGVLTERFGTTGTLPLLWVWLAAGVAMGLALWLLTPGVSNRPGAGSAGNKAASLAG